MGGFQQTFKEQIIPILCKLFQKILKGRKPSNIFCKASLIVISKPGYVCKCDLVYTFCCFTYGLCWVFTIARAFLWLWLSGAILQLQGTGFSLPWLLLLRSTGPGALQLQQLQHVGSVVVDPGL